MVKVSNLHKLMGALMIISLLTVTLTAFLGFGVMAGFVVYKDVIGFALPLIATIILTFMSSTLIAFLAKDN